jgi:hypothetical protein
VAFSDGGTDDQTADPYTVISVFVTKEEEKRSSW